MLKGINQRLSADLVHALMLMGHGDDQVAKGRPGGNGGGGVVDVADHQIIAVAHQHQGMDQVGGQALVDAFQHYFTAPAAMPLMIKRSRAMPMMTKGRMAAKDRAAIDHQLIPCEPVCEATMTGRVLA